ncbi:hypothetical protein IMZ48_43535, partial [Candidatus Bathyarchaeota archaeon]|nr:hypothetical protein [Candidatus Bathyarchaeota archaeon]
MSTAVKCLARRRLAPPPPPITEKDAISNIRLTLTAPPPLGRADMSLAFDPLAASDKPSSPGHLDPSVFDRTMSLVVLDVAPFVRGIVAANEQRRRETVRAGGLVSEGGTGKRRRTRAALSAGEG